MDIGELVEVHTKYDGTWVPGFVIAEVVPGGYRVCRSSDRTMLPGVTGPADVRPARSGLTAPREG